MYKLSDLSKEWVNSLPKTINSNQCWVHDKVPDSDGYTQIMIERNHFRLARLVVSIYYNLNYYDYSWDSRHSKGCSRACFWIEHLQPGTSSDNVRDSVEHKTQKNSKKEYCPKCGGEYVTRVQKTGWGKGEVHRHCPKCRAEYNIKWEKKNRRKNK